MCQQIQSESGTKYTRAGLVSLRDFYMVSGWLANTQYKDSDKSDFDWDNEDQGIIKGNIIKLRKILSESKFKDFRIETKINYEWRNCNEDYQSPCPYFYTAIASLFAPSILASFTLLIIVCLSKCFKRGMYNSGIYLFLSYKLMFDQHFVKHFALWNYALFLSTRHFNMEIEKKNARDVLLNLSNFSIVINICHSIG